MSVDPNGDSRDSRRGTEGGCCHADCRARTNIDRAIARAGTTGENEGYALPADGTVVADHEVAPVQDVGAWAEVERSSARDLDPPAIDSWRNCFGPLLAQSVTGSRASGIGRNFEAGIGIDDGRGVGRQVPRGGYDGTGRKRVAAGRKMFPALSLAPLSNSVDSASREALYRSQVAGLTMVSRLSSPKPTDNLSVSPRAITQVLRDVPSNATAATFVIGGWRRNVPMNLDDSRRCTGSAPGATAGSRISAVTA